MGHYSFDKRDGSWWADHSSEVLGEALPIRTEAEWRQLDEGSSQ